MTTPDPHSEAWLDAQLREVPLPDGLLDRLGGVIGASDDEIDAALRDVRLPALFLWRLRQIVEVPTRLARLRRWSVAASLFLAIGFSYVAAMLIVLASVYKAPSAPRLPLGPYITVDVAAEVDREPLVFRPASALADAGAAGEPGSDETLVAEPEIDLVALGPGRPPALDFTMHPFGASVDADVHSDMELSQWPLAGTLSSHNGFDDLPELPYVPGLVTRWLPPPVVPGFDVFFLRQYGVHPLVSPAAHRDLLVSQVPLSVDTSSYELARRYFAGGMMPPRGALRTEEFLAAIDYRYPLPKKGKGLSLYMAGGPTPFRGGACQLLQIGVTAEQVQDHRRPGTRMTLVLDVSTSMQWGGRLEMVCRALRRMTPRMAADDRISLVIFNERAQVVAEDLVRDDMGQLLDVLVAMKAEGSTNVGAGLRLGCALADRYDGTDKRVSRVVLLTDALAELDGGTSDWIEQRLAQAAARGIRLDAVDLGQERKEEALDRQLVRFAEAGGGAVHRATSAEQACWALLEIGTGQPQLVASEARLRVAFNPDTVLNYRLLGHEAKAILVLNPPRIEAEMYSGQSATGLYEVRLKPGSGRDVAVAELSWCDPATGRRHTLRRKFQRGQFAATAAESPPALQSAMIVAQAVEVLRDVPYVWGPPSAGGLARVLDRARHLDSRVYHRQSFNEFVTMLEQAIRARPYRRGGYK